MLVLLLLANLLKHMQLLKTWICLNVQAADVLSTQRPMLNTRRSVKMSSNRRGKSSIAYSIVLSQMNINKSLLKPRERILLLVKLLSQFLLVRKHKRLIDKQCKLVEGVWKLQNGKCSLNSLELQWEMQEYQSHQRREAMVVAEAEIFLEEATTYLKNMMTGYPVITVDVSSMK